MPKNQSSEDIESQARMSLFSTSSGTSQMLLAKEGKENKKVKLSSEELEL